MKQIDSIYEKYNPQQICILSEQISIKQLIKHFLEYLNIMQLDTTRYSDNESIRYLEKLIDAWKTLQNVIHRNYPSYQILISSEKLSDTSESEFLEKSKDYFQICKHRELINWNERFTYLIANQRCSQTNNEPGYELYKIKTRQKTHPVCTTKDTNENGLKKVLTAHLDQCLQDEALSEYYQKLWYDRLHSYMERQIIKQPAIKTKMLKNCNGLFPTKDGLYDQNLKDHADPQEYYKNPNISLCTPKSEHRDNFLTKCFQTFGNTRQDAVAFAKFLKTCMQPAQTENGLIVIIPDDTGFSANVCQKYLYKIVRKLCNTATINADYLKNWKSETTTTFQHNYNPFHPMKTVIFTKNLNVDELLELKHKHCCNQIIITTNTYAPGTRLTLNPDIQYDKPDYLDETDITTEEQHKTSLLYEVFRLCSNDFKEPPHGILT